MTSGLRQPAVLDLDELAAEDSGLMCMAVVGLERPQVGVAYRATGN